MEDFGAQFYFSTAATSFLQFYFGIAATSFLQFYLSIAVSIAATSFLQFYAATSLLQFWALGFAFEQPVHRGMPLSKWATN